jgi:hypothetical protein
MHVPAELRPVTRPAPARTAPHAHACREPESTVLHVVVREHLATFLSVFREQHGKGLPRYVEQELRRYLRCGIFAHGFARVVCATCHSEMLVAFSCKHRASCPSSGARRACATAAHLVDDVLSDVRVRQLTAPFEVRRVLALRPAALTAEGRIFVEEIARWQKEQAKARGIEGGETGAITFVQRFSATLQCFVHFHVLARGGVFTRAEARDSAAVFHPGSKGERRRGRRRACGEADAVAETPRAHRRARGGGALERGAVAVADGGVSASVAVRGRIRADRGEK